MQTLFRESVLGTIVYPPLLSFDFIFSKKQKNKVNIIIYNNGIFEFLQIVLCDNNRFASLRTSLANESLLIVFEVNKKLPALFRATYIA